MTLHVELHVKFRYLLDWGRIDKKWDVPLVVPPGPAASLVRFDERGVRFSIELRPAVRTDR